MSPKRGRILSSVMAVKVPAAEYPPWMIQLMSEANPVLVF